MVLGGRHAGHGDWRAGEGNCAFEDWRADGLDGYALPTCTLANDRYVVCVAAKVADVIFDEVEGQVLVVEAIVLRNETGSTGAVHEAQNPKAVVDGHHDEGCAALDSMQDKICGIIVWSVPRAKKECAAVDEDQNR